MSNFWATKLNGQQPAPPPIAVSRDLYAVYQQATTPQSVPQPQSIPQQEYVPTSQTTKGQRCPGCGSDSLLTQGSYTMPCGECGWHPRFTQSTYGLNNAPTDRNAKNVTPARQNDRALPLSASLALLEAGGGAHITEL